MNLTGKLLAVIFVAISSICVQYQPAYAIDGTASGIAKEKFSVKTCGKYSENFVFNNLIMNSNGTWFVDMPTGTYSGTWTDANPSKPDRKFNLNFDNDSLILFTNFLENAATILCEGGPTTITLLDTSNFIAKTK